MSRVIGPPEEKPTVPQRTLAGASGDAAWIDRVIGGKYAVEGILGRGGMGMVLKARHLMLDEPVAIKVLHASLASDTVMATRMMREARAVLRLQSEHIVRVMDVDTLENGTPYLVLEYLEGTDLASLMRKRGAPLPWEEAVAIVDQACRALSEAHALGIVHRDLKPANLFIVQRPDGRRIVKLLDFGISKARSAADRETPITVRGEILGSPRYMAPEQIRSDRLLDGRADIWAVGVVLYELLTNATPFLGNNFASACLHVLEDVPVPIATLRPDLPAGLSDIVSRCLEKDPDHRFLDAVALRDALAPFGVISGRAGSQISLPDMTGAHGALLSWRPAPPSAAPISIAPPPSGAPISIAPPPSGAPASTTPPPESPGSALADEQQLARVLASGRPRPPGALRRVALVGLGAGLAAGLLLLVLRRGDEAPASTASPAASGKPSGTAVAAPSASLAAVAQPTPPADAEAPSSAPVAAATASTSPLPQPAAAKPPPHVGTIPAGVPKAPPTSADPFGERRQ